MNIKPLIKNQPPVNPAQTIDPNNTMIGTDTSQLDEMQKKLKKLQTLNPDDTTQTSFPAIRNWLNG